MIFCNGRTLPSQVEAIIHGSFLSTVHMISEMVHHFGNPEGNGYEYVAELNLVGFYQKKGTDDGSEHQD